MERGVEGIVVIAPRVPMAHVAQAVSATIPIVMLAPGEVSQRGITVFAEDQELGARLATRHLVHLGHREIAHLAGSQEWLDGQVRLRGWQAELAAHKIPAVAVQYGDWSGDSAYRIGQKMVADGYRARSSWRPISWRWASCAPSTRTASPCPETSRSWASTTTSSPRRSTPL